MTDKPCFMVCENLVREVTAAVKSSESVRSDADVVSYHASCVRAEVGWEELSRTAAGIKNGRDRVLLLGSAGCLSSEPLPASMSDVRVLRVEQCCHLFLDKCTVDALIAEGAFLVTPGWLGRWRQTIDRWSFDRDMARAFFARLATRLVLVDTGVDPLAPTHLAEMAAFVDLPCSIIPAGLDGLRLQLEKSELARLLGKEKKSSQASTRPGQEATDRDFAFEFLDRLSRVTTETSAVDAVFDLYGELVAAARLAYVPLLEGVSGTVQLRPEGKQVDVDAMARFSEDFAWNESGTGFRLLIKHAGEALGVLEVDGLSVREHRERCASTAHTVARLCGLAVANARARERTRKAEESLAAERERLSATLRSEQEQVRKLSLATEQSPASVVITNLQGDIEYVNPKFTHVTGYTREEAVGKNPRLLKSGEKGPEEYREMWKTITGGQEWRGEFHNRKKSGELYWEWASISPIRDASGCITHFIAVKEDITERKRAEEENQRLQESLRMRAAELDAVNRELEAFAYSLTHDLRAPLRSIDGFSQALIEDYSNALDAQGREFLEYVRAATRRMNQLIDDMLNLSRVTRVAKESEPVDLSALTAEIVADLRRADPDRLVQCDIAPGLVATCDARLLRIALENLLANAWKFTAHEANARVEFGATRERGEMAFYVRDNGVGFDMKFVDRLFDPFQRLHGEHEFPGTGIGLATVQRIIHRHGGRVWAAAALGDGATFYFTLPSS